jgi:predicted AlkP superfamily phosphohydrolase/phosphomutase
MPKSRSPPLSFEMILRPVRPGRDVKLYGLLIDEEGGGYDTLLLCRERDPRKNLCRLRAGSWAAFDLEFEVEGRTLVGGVRLKLVELSPDGSRIKIYRSQVHPKSEFAYLPEVGKELTEKFGPYINEAVERFIQILDRETVTEEFTYQIKWIANAVGYLMGRGAQLFMMHWHLLDAVQHAYLARVDPAAGGYTPEKAEEAWEIIKMAYRLADMLVGEFLNLLDDESYLIVISDHGHVPNKKRYPLLKALLEAGLVTATRNEEGDLVVDWERSKIHISTTNIYVNLKSRYKNGVVDDSEYEEVRSQLIELLRSLRDEEGRPVISFAFRREDAAMIGLWGEPVGDVVYAYSPGYTWSHNRFEEKVSVDKGANHGPQIPTTETTFGSNYAVFMITGPNVKRGYVRPLELLGPVLTIDVAPTASYLLGVDPPRHSQGRILYDFLDGWNVSEIKRERRRLKFPGKPQPIIGDVTEYIL